MNLAEWTSARLYALRQAWEAVCGAEGTDDKDIAEDFKAVLQAANGAQDEALVMLDKEIVRRWCCEQEALSKALHKGDDVWYVDYDEGFLEHGVVDTVSYKGGKLDAFGVNFVESGDYDVFAGEAYGTTFFPTEKGALTALLSGPSEEEGG